jgi:hypothetical protein
MIVAARRVRNARPLLASMQMLQKDRTNVRRFAR